MAMEQHPTENSSLAHNHLTGEETDDGGIVEDSEQEPSGAWVSDP